MKTITMKSGLELEIRDNLMNDMELLDDLAELDEGNSYAVSRIVNRILGKNEKKKLYDDLREDGVTPVNKVVEAMTEIFQLLGDKGKNS